MMSCEMELAERIYFDSNKVSHDLLNPGFKTSGKQGPLKISLFLKKKIKQTSRTCF